MLRTGTWRLDQIRQNGQTISSGANIKDRYSLTFHRDGTYSQKLLADNTTFTGASWMLMSNDTMLHLTDHKGTESQYKVESLTSSELRYSFTNKDSQLEERVFSAQP
ncbi:lipocalin family protein [uncultured Hymenobacter sp.]|uniref:lipocalin family protein n=1 Tax=uncultured Hymenobacter sp. TaxID=170016 RepID=UPI0035CB2587